MGRYTKQDVIDLSEKMMSNLSDYNFLTCSEQ